MTVLGLTWDHPRGYDALAEAARLVNGSAGTALIHWEKQPLEGFESAPIADLAARYDLVVLDHPHIGEAVAEECLIPLEALYPDAKIAAWENQSVGPSFASYAWDGRHWALPLDVATQVMARRADILGDPPADLAEVLAAAARLPVAQSLAGPHALLTLFSLAAGQGAPVGGADLLPDAAIASALEHMHRLYRLRPPGSETLNPIALLEAMSCTNELALIPLVFGYVTYAGGDAQGARLSFSNTIRSANGAGGVLGGTGIAFSRRSPPGRQLLDHIAWLMSVETQSVLIPEHGGQPSARAAWQSAKVNAAADGFYRMTLATAEHALLRPRFDGYIAFQTAASTAIRGALAQHETETKTIGTLRTLWRAARDGARGDLDDMKGTPR